MACVESPSEPGPKAAPHLVVDISAHGFGHAGQLAPVIAALRARVELRLTLRTALPREKLDELFASPFETAAPSPDLGMAMHTPFDVDAAASLEAYAALHRNWPAVVSREAERLVALRPALLLSDVGYVGLAAAAARGVPAVALSSMNWEDLFRAYCGEMPGAADILRQIHAAYAGCDLFVQVTPHMPMADLPRRCTVGPVARLARLDRVAVRRQLALRPGERLVLVSLGGLDAGGIAVRLPQLDGVRWIRHRAGAGRADLLDLDDLDIAFIDLIGACDAVVTKSGYGLPVEAVCNGVALLYAPRPDWPEDPFLSAWLRDSAVSAQTDRRRLASGDFGRDLMDLLRQTARRPRPAPNGASQAADLLAERLVAAR